MKTDLKNELREMMKKYFSDHKLASKFSERIEEGKLTQDENPKSHFCVYFAAYDPAAKEVLIGHHKKAGIWLVNGGHIDRGETLQDTLRREIGEEWGLDPDELDISNPAFITLKKIYNPEKQLCRRHYDIWHFVSVDKNTFKPDQNKLAKEYREIKWKPIDEAKKLVAGDDAHLAGINFLGDNLSRWNRNF